MLCTNFTKAHSLFVKTKIIKLILMQILIWFLKSSSESVILTGCLSSPSPCGTLSLAEEGKEGEEKVVSTLRSELWEKERKLTDIRLEALSSAHQLEQLQEAMNSMQVRVTTT